MKTSIDVENLGQLLTQLDWPATIYNTEQSFKIIPPALILPGQTQGPNFNDCSRPPTARNIFDSYEFLNGMDLIYEASTKSKETNLKDKDENLKENIFDKDCNYNKEFNSSSDEESKYETSYNPSEISKSVVKESNPETSLKINEIESSSQITKNESKPSKDAFSEKLIQYLINQEFDEKLMNFDNISINEVSELNQQEGDFAQKLNKKFEKGRKSHWAWINKNLDDPFQSGILKVLCITWNMAGKKPPEEIFNLFRLKEVQHHIIAVGTQECCRSILASVIYSSKADWEKKINEELGHQYYLIKSITLNAMHLMVFCHHKLINSISDISSEYIACGVGNVIGNKGGIGISFKFSDHSFMFLNSHLASGQGKNKIKRRNKDFLKIEKKFQTDKYDSCFWMGDFNYRINLTNQEFQDFFKRKRFDILLKYDQFHQERNNKADIFNKFKEGLVLFPPTYKLFPFQNDYYLENVNRVPGWTDRILYKGQGEIKQFTYDSIKDLFLSDHRPVFSQFIIPFEKENKNEDYNGILNGRTKNCDIF